MEQPTTQTEHKSKSVAGRDDGPVNKYFSIVPHIDDDDLDLYEYRLLGHYRKLFGLGLPPETNSQTAIVTGMSVKAVRAARQRLVEKRRITINELTGVVVLVSLVDVMAENVRRYTNNPSPKRQGLDMTYPYPKRKGGYAQKGRGGMPKREGVTPDEPSSDAGKTPPKELEEEKNTDSSSLHSEESRAAAQSASHGTPADPGGDNIAATPKAQTLPPPSVSGNGTNTPPQHLTDSHTLPPAEPTPAEVAAALERQGARKFDTAEATAVLVKAAERRTLDPAPVGFEWWFAGDNAGVAHLLKGGKGKPLCKPKHWKFPNKCPNFQLFTVCPDCVRIAAEPKASQPHVALIEAVQAAAGNGVATCKQRAIYVFGKQWLTDGVTVDQMTCSGNLYRTWYEALPGKPIEVYDQGWFKNTVDRALNLCRAGIVPQDVADYVKDLRGHEFWRGKLISFKYVCDNIQSWKGEIASQPKRVIYDKNCPHCLGSGVVMPIDSNDAYPCDCGRLEE